MMFNYPGLLLSIFKNKLNIISYPSFVTYLVTYKCNAKCLICDIWKKPDGYEMNLNEIYNVFEQLKHLDVIRITGGEPFVRDDLADIINIIQERNRPGVIHITTNGLLKERILDLFDKIKKRKNIHIKISINAYGAEHDRIMGFEGAFETAMGTLKGLVKIRNKYGFFVGVNQTIATKQSMENYGKLKEACSKLDVDLLPVLAYSETALYSDKECMESFPETSGKFNIFYNFSEDELKNMLKMFMADAAKSKNIAERLIKRYYLRGAYNRLILGKGHPSPHCVALKNHLRILPNGDVPVCLYNSSAVGNLRRQSFEEIWFGEEIEKYRRRTKACPGCWAECEIGPNSVYTGDIIV